VIAYDQFEHASVTDVGIRRPYNQDSHAVLLASNAEQWRDRGHIFMVADGMGAHAVGELASELAASIVPHTYYKHAPEGPDLALRKAFVEANASIYARGQQNREFEGMGTTATALLLREEGAWIGHVGDSRAYRIRDGVIEQLTFDHSLVWELAKRQKVNPDTLHGVPSNVIVRSLGPDALVEVDIEGPHPLEPGDTFLLCSDGLSGQVTNTEMGAVASVLPPAEACRFLVNLANLRGGPDNITALIVHVGGNNSQPAPLPPTEEPPPSSRPLRTYWPLGALSLGVILAGLAFYLTAMGQSLAAWAAFVVAPLALLAGLGGMSAQHFQGRQPPPAESGRRRPKVYRPTPCRVERVLVERLAQAESILKNWANERHWEVDWTAQKDHHELAENLLTQNDLPAAFREYCRAVRPLAETLQQYRSREELIQPLWERTPNDRA
jgi:protein phosphatase